MANTRVFDEIAAVKADDGASGIDVGGVSSIEVRQGYVHKTQSGRDGGQGSARRAQAGMTVTGTLASTDVLQLVPLMITTLVKLDYYGRQSGAATWTKGTLINPVFHAGRFNSSLANYATISADLTCRFADGTKVFKDVAGFVDGQGAPTIVQPAPFWRPQSCTFGGLSPVHVQSLGFTIPGELLTDYGDTDKGLTAVDVAGWGDPTVELVTRDSSKQTGPPTHDMATALIESGIEDLVCTFDAVGSTDTKILTIRNVKFEEAAKTGGLDWTGHRLTGTVQWEDPDDPWTLRTLNHATAAERLINWADPA